MGEVRYHTFAFLMGDSTLKFLSVETPLGKESTVSRTSSQSHRSISCHLFRESENMHLVKDSTK